VRFSDRLRPRLVVDDDVRDAAVPSFILQPLVENALRHGLAKRTDAGDVEIGAQRDGQQLVLWVRDDGPGVRAAQEEGVGLATTRDRLRTRGGDAGRREPVSERGKGATATLHVPFRRLTRNGDA